MHTLVSVLFPKDTLLRTYLTLFLNRMIAKIESIHLQRPLSLKQEQTTKLSDIMGSPANNKLATTEL